MSSVEDMTLAPNIHPQEPSFSSITKLLAYAPGDPAQQSSSLPHRSLQPYPHLNLVESLE